MLELPSPVSSATCSNLYLVEAIDDRIDFFFIQLESVRDADKAMDKQTGQDVIDSLSVLRVTATALHEGLRYRLVELLPKLSLALRSRFAIIRQCTARCFATICNVITAEAMKYVIEHVIPYLGDSKTTVNRQGVIELIYRE